MMSENLLPLGCTTEISLSFLCSQGSHDTRRLQMNFLIWQAETDDILTFFADQDIVSRSAKFILLYKRSEHRVLINRLGDLLVRPRAIEASLRLTPFGGSVQQHLLTSYAQSIVSILVSQFRPTKGTCSNMRSVLQLVKSSPTFQVRISSEYPFNNCIGAPTCDISKVMKPLHNFIGQILDAMNSRLSSSAWYSEAWAEKLLICAAIIAWRGRAWCVRPAGGHQGKWKQCFDFESKDSEHKKGESCCQSKRIWKRGSPTARVRHPQAFEFVWRRVSDIPNPQTLPLWLQTWDWHCCSISKWRVLASFLTAYWDILTYASLMTRSAASSAQFSAYIALRSVQAWPMSGQRHARQQTAVIWVALSLHLGSDLLCMQEWDLLFLLCPAQYMAGRCSRPWRRGQIRCRIHRTWHQCCGW